jgi:alkanesulfonate monooxygenase SsuD/methylene tetrahydromethanopterin reductase-like flavin-dependent oxidoreductase (luciferase family)
MVDQLARPTDKVEVYWFSEHPNSYVRDEDLEKYDATRFLFPNSYFDPEKAHVLYNQYHEQYALVDEVGFDGIMTNEHHTAYWCMKPAANLDAAVLAKVTKRVKIAILGNVIAINDPVRMAEEIAMLDCYSGGRIISGFVRGSSIETLQAGIDPTENRSRFEEAHDLILKCWTTPGPFRFEGQHFHRRVVNPWVLPMQKPHPDIWFPGTGSPESVIWAAEHGYPYMNLQVIRGQTEWLKEIYIETAREAGYTPGPGNFGGNVMVFCADTDEKAQEIGRTYMWHGKHRFKGPAEHNDPPGYRSRAAVEVIRKIPAGVGVRLGQRERTYEELQEAGSIAVGSPDTVIKKLTEILDTVAPGYLICYGNEGDMPYEDVMRSIELIGKEVIPALHEVKLKPYE